MFVRNRNITKKKKTKKQSTGHPSPPLIPPTKPSPPTEEKTHTLPENSIPHRSNEQKQKQKKKKRVYCGWPFKQKFNGFKKGRERETHPSPPDGAKITLKIQSRQNC